MELVGHILSVVGCFFLPFRHRRRQRRIWFNASSSSREENGYEYDIKEQCNPREDAKKDIYEGNQCLGEYE
jgi:hypothetical protein